jgi:dinuclear metal center YbgI/SA1388 family protein
MIVVKDILRALESVAPFSYQEEYDNSGLLVGSSEAAVKGVLLSLDITDSVIEEAIANKCNLIVSHHPIIFRGIKQLVDSTLIGRLLIKAVQHNISIIAIHTNLDNVPHGVNFALAKALRLSNTRILQPKQGLLRKLVTFCPEKSANQVRNALFEAGCGHIGRYDACSYNTEGSGTFRAQEGSNPYVGSIGQIHVEPEIRIETIFPAHLEKAVVKALQKNHPYEEVAYDIFVLQNANPYIGAGLIGELPLEMGGEEFLLFVKNQLEINGLRYAGATSKTIHRVAICGGSGAFLIQDAIRAGADAYITGDIKYHEFFDHQHQLVLVDAGHYETERYSISLLSDILTEKFNTFAVLISKINTNPVRFL